MSEMDGRFYQHKGDAMYIDPKTLKPCKHKWVPFITDMNNNQTDPLAQKPGWILRAKCSKCGEDSKRGDNVSLRKLVKQLG